MDQVKAQKSRKGSISKGVDPSDVEPFDPSLPLKNERHELFCIEFSVTKNRVRSYLKQYPDTSYNAACSSANDLLRNPKIQARADYLAQEHYKSVTMSAEEVLAGLSRAARFDPADLYNADGSTVAIPDLPPEVRLCIEKVEFEEIIVEGKKIGRTGKIHTISKKSAYEMLAKHHKLLVDRVIHTHKISLEDLLSSGEDNENSPDCG